MSRPTQTRAPTQHLRVSQCGALQKLHDRTCSSTCKKSLLHHFPRCVCFQTHQPPDNLLQSLSQQRHASHACFACCYILTFLSPLKLAAAPFADKPSVIRYHPFLLSQQGTLLACQCQGHLACPTALNTAGSVPHHWGSTPHAKRASLIHQRPHRLPAPPSSSVVFLLDRPLAISGRAAELRPPCIPAGASPRGCQGAPRGQRRLPRLRGGADRWSLLDVSLVCSRPRVTAQQAPVLPIRACASAAAPYVPTYLLPHAQTSAASVRPRFSLRRAVFRKFHRTRSGNVHFLKHC